MNRYGYYYEVEYRLDNIEDYDATEYSDEFDSKADAIKYANGIKREYGNRVVLLGIHKYDEQELVDAWELI